MIPECNFSRPLSRVTLPYSEQPEQSHSCRMSTSPCLRRHVGVVLSLLALLFLATPSLTTASDVAAATWHDCSPSSGSLLRLSSVTLTNGTDSTLVPGAWFTATITGALSEAISAGLFTLQADGSHTSGVASSTGFLSQVLAAGSLPLQPSGQAEMHFRWQLPADDAFDHKDTSLSLRVSMYAQDESEVVCVSFSDVPLSVPKASTSKSTGYLCALVSVVFFGINFLPVKQYDTGDGVFFQWVMCFGVWLAGLVVQIVRDSPFEPLAMAGGLMWALGNITTCTIISLIGLGIGMGVWGTTGLLMGWACGRFGILGVQQQTVDNAALNWIGVILCTTSVAIMFNVKTVKEEKEVAATAAACASHEDDGTVSRKLSICPSSKSASGITDLSLRDTLLPTASHSLTVSPNSSDAVDDALAPSSSPPTTKTPGGGWVDSMSPSARRGLGLGMSVFAGCMYGLNFNPPQYLIDSGRGKSSHGIDYVFSHFCGILITSTAYFVGYAIMRKNRPAVDGRLVLPSLASGIAWAMAQISWFVANDQIGFVGTFPLISCGPSIVATVCAIVFYQEIAGKKNFLALAAAAVVIGVGVGLIAMSLPSDS